MRRPLDYGTSCFQLHYNKHAISLDDLTLVMARLQVKDGNEKLHYRLFHVWDRAHIDRTEQHVEGESTADSSFTENRTRPYDKDSAVATEARGDVTVEGASESTPTLTAGNTEGKDEADKDGNTKRAGKVEKGAIEGGQLLDDSSYTIQQEYPQPHQLPLRPIPLSGAPPTRVQPTEPPSSVQPNPVLPTYQEATLYSRGDSQSSTRATRFRVSECAPSVSNATDDDRKRPAEGRPRFESSKRSRMTKSGNRVDVLSPEVDDLAMQPDVGRFGLKNRTDHTEEFTSPVPSIPFQNTQTGNLMEAPIHGASGEIARQLVDDGPVTQRNAQSCSHVEAPNQEADTTAAESNGDGSVIQTNEENNDEGMDNRSFDNQGQQNDDGEDVQPEIIVIDGDDVGVKEEDLSAEDAAEMPLEVYFALTQVNSEGSEVLGFITAKSRAATFADLRAIIQDEHNLPKEWRFYFPTLGPVAERQERSLGPVAHRLECAGDASLGDGRLVAPFQLNIVMKA